MSHDNKEDPIDSGDVLAILRREELYLASRLELVRRQVAEREAHESSWQSAAQAVRQGEFEDLTPQKAVMRYMKKCHAKAPTRQEIIDAVIAGGTYRYHRVKDAVKSVNQAISVLVKKGALVEPGRKGKDRRPSNGSRIGIPEWNSSSFE